MRTFVLEHHVFQYDILVCWDILYFILLGGFFVIHVVDLVQSFRTDFCILRLLNESDKLRNGTVQLPQYVLHGHHHT